MPISRRPNIPLACALVAAITLTSIGILSLHRSPAARAASIGNLQQQIGAGQGQISSLAQAVSAASSRLAALNGNIGDLQVQIFRIQNDLDAKQAQLVKLRNELAAARAHLAQLIAYEKHAEGVLSKQLVGTYESPNPDLVGVVLDAKGFQDLLERLSFAQRIQKQDVQVIKQVRAARRAVAAQAEHLGALEVGEQAIVEQVRNQRDSLLSSRLNLVQEQLSVAQIRREKSSQLSSARGQVADLQQQLSQAQAAQAAQTARAPSAAGSSSTPGDAASGPAGETLSGVSGASSSGVSSESASDMAADSGSGALSESTGSVSPSAVSSSGGFVFPMPKGAASPPSTWSLDDGVDISAAGGTPELAVCSGTIVLHGIGGFGPWAPVLHCDSPVGGYSYVYYGHAGPANQLPIGTHVGAGQVISEVGPGIVGISTGPHLEIGFCDSSGTPLGDPTAPTMLSLLQSAYGG